MIDSKYQIPEPFQFNPLKHHLAFIRGFISGKLTEEKGDDIKVVVKELKLIGTSVMDLYTGRLSIKDICNEIFKFLESKKLKEYRIFAEWAGRKFSDFRTITLSDTSEWMLKYNNDRSRYVHLFPVRMSPHSLRIKANTLKSAIIYYIIIGKDFISADDLNRARALLDLSPVKNPEEAEAITEMIEILRL
jgi:hypothetical protein